METDRTIRIIIVEDVPSDAELAERELRQGGVTFTSMRVEKKEEFLKALKEFRPALIISDYSLPEFDGLQALRLAREYDAAIPFIVFTGSINEETAVACMKAGATDYVLKDRIARLPFAVKEALEQRKTRLAKEVAEQALAEEAIRRRILIEQSRDGIVVLDQNGKVYEANQRFADMLGYSAEEMSELHVWDWDFQWTREELLEKIRLVDVSGDHFETRHRRKNGTVYDVEISTNGVEWKNQKLVFCVCRDISERKAAEAEIGRRVK